MRSLNFSTTLLLPVLVMFPFLSQAQSYNTSLGLRWGDGIGITARQRVLKKTTLEGIFYKHREHDFTIGGLMMDHHMPLLTKRLNIYAGGGIAYVDPDNVELVNTPYNAVLINAGLEFTIARLNLSWDFVPVIPVTKEQSMETMTAFSMRYVLVKKPKKGLFKNDKRKRKNHKRGGRGK